MCAGGVDNLEDARRCAYEQDQAYACGIHPLYIRSSWKEDLTALEAFLEEHQDDPRLAAVGECGLDFLLPAAFRMTFRKKFFLLS